MTKFDPIRDLPAFYSHGNISPFSRDHIEVERLMSGDFGVRCLGWIREAWPSVTHLRINIYFGSAEGPRGSVLHVVDSASDFFIVSIIARFEGTVPDPLGESVTLVATVNAFFKALAKGWGIGDPPWLGFTETEDQWVAEHGQPKILIKKVPIQYTDHRSSQEGPDTVERDYDTFDVWPRPNRYSTPSSGAGRLSGETPPL